MLDRAVEQAGVGARSSGASRSVRKIGLAMPYYAFGSTARAEPSDMTVTWNDNTPIYRQLRDRVVAMILDGVLKQGDALPSVRQVAADFQLNPITVSKAYQELVDEQLVEKRRGLGMYVNEGAREMLLKSERERFLREEWPVLRDRLRSPRPRRARAARGARAAQRQRR